MNRLSTWWFMGVPGAVTWALLAYYHFARRGVLNPLKAHPGDPQFVFLANKALAITGMLLIGASVAVGPLAHWSAAFRRWASVRRQIGMAGFGFIVLHVLTVTLLLGQRFPWRWYVDHATAGLAGVVSLAVLVLIAATSNARAQRWLGPRRWKLIQRLVYPVIFLAVLHYAAMGKPANWANWYRQMPTVLPPGTLVLTVALAFCLLARCSVWIPRRTGAAGRLD